MSKRPGKKGDVVQVTEDGGITKKVVEEGNGELIPNGVTAKVHYTGRLTNGHVFDSSHSRGRPFTFKIGAREVILGWDKGIATMTKGEHAVLTCSPDYAYGSRAVGPIPANSTLEFEVELVGWEHKTNTGPMLLAAVGISMFAIFAYLFYFSYKHGRIKED